MGFECQRCIPGYYGDITAGVPCQGTALYMPALRKITLIINFNTDCGCNEIGITTPCDLNLGTCFCKENVIGDQCTECADGFWGLTDGQEECIPCDCCANGSVSNLCNKARKLLICIIIILNLTIRQQANVTAFQMWETINAACALQVSLTSNLLLVVKVGCNYF